MKDLLYRASKTGGLVAFYFTFSISLTFYNKWLMKVSFFYRRIVIGCGCMLVNCIVKDLYSKITIKVHTVTAIYSGTCAFKTGPAISGLIIKVF